MTSIHNGFKKKSPGISLEDEHQEANGLLRRVASQMFVPISHVQDVLVRVLVVHTAKGTLPRQEQVDEGTKRPNVARREGFLLSKNLRCCGSD